MIIGKKVNLGQNIFYNIYGKNDKEWLLDRK